MASPKFPPKTFSNLGRSLKIRDGHFSKSSSYTAVTQVDIATMTDPVRTQPEYVNVSASNDDAFAYLVSLVEHQDRVSRTSWK
jgi:hypothetical protein